MTKSKKKQEIFPPITLEVGYTVIYNMDSSLHYEAFPTLLDAQLFISDWTLAHLGKGIEDGYGIEALILGEIACNSGIFTKGDF